MTDGIFSSQTELFAITVALGFAGGFLFDMFRIIRKIFNHPFFLIQIEDFLYWLAVSIFVFYFILQSGGELRAFLIIGVVLGMLLYFCSLSLLIMKVAGVVIEVLKKIVSAMIRLILYPVRLVWAVLMFPVRLLGTQAAKFKKPMKKVLQNSESYAKIKVRKTIRDLRIIMKKV